MVAVKIRGWGANAGQKRAGRIAGFLWSGLGAKSYLTGFLIWPGAPGPDPARAVLIDRCACTAGRSDVPCHGSYAVEYNRSGEALSSPPALLSKRDSPRIDFLF